MKSGLLFSLTTGGISLFFLLVSAYFMLDLSTEATSHLLWFFIIWTVVCVMIFPLAVPLIRPLTTGRIWKIMIYLALGLVSLNFPIGAQDNKWITFETMRDLLHPKAESPNDLTSSIGVFHILPLLAFSLSMLFFRNRLFDAPPEPPAEKE